ncbi:putative protein TPRXL [Pecten maximus]|uniref:putative protein TPRXL n=1 Tax=Pecten maximus TaxID=6579 RepID=UPI0014580825|nr:putative protein TPRXL [Pecten maximus]
MLGVFPRLLCVSLVLLAVFGHVSETVPVWNTGSDSNYTPVQPTRMNSSLIYRWLIRLMSRKDLYSWINFHVHPHLLPKTTVKTDTTTPAVPLSDNELQIQRDTDEFGTVPIVGPRASSSSGNEAQDAPTSPALIVVRDVEDATTSHPVTLLSTASIVNNGIPMIILSGNKDVDRIGDNSQTTSTDDSSTPQMIRDTFDDMPVAGGTMSPSDKGDNTAPVPIIVNPGGNTDDDSNSNSDSTNDPDSSLTIVRDKEGDSDIQSNNDTPSSSSSSSTSQSSTSTSGSTSSSGLLILNPADLLNQGFNLG